MASLLSDISLLFEVNVAKWMVLKERRCPRDVLREYIELVLPRGPKAQGPDLGLELSGTAHRDIVGFWVPRGHNGTRSGNQCSVTAGMEGVRIEREGIGAAVVEAMATFQLKAHAGKPILTREAYGARNGVVLEALLGPTIEYVA